MVDFDFIVTKAKHFMVDSTTPSKEKAVRKALSELVSPTDLAITALTFDMTLDDLVETIMDLM
jgi:hypothetical protein